MCGESSSFLKFCEETNCPKFLQIQRAFECAQVTGEFDISGCIVSAQTGFAISQVLLKSKNIRKFSSRNCLMSPRGMSFIFNSLKRSTHIKEINLLGNNISDNCGILGDMIATNKVIKNLGLKWNNLGGEVTAFSNFCDGLAKNRSLEALDLRCNGICPQGVTCLANALKENTTLKYLDLRWNNIQSHGAEHLLAALGNNKTLVALKIDGNLIQRDISNNVEQCLIHNAMIKRVMSECEERTNLLTKQVKLLKVKRLQELNEANEKTQKQIKDAETKIDKLTEDTEAKGSIIRDITEKLSARESDLRLEKRKVGVLEEAIKERDKTYKETMQNNKKKIESLKKTLEEREEEYTRVKAELDAKLGDAIRLREAAESELRSRIEEVNHLRVEINDFQHSQKKSIKYYTDKLEAEKNMWQKRFTDLETSSEAALQRLRATAFDKQQCLENNILEISEKQSIKLMTLSEKLERANSAKCELEVQVLSAQSTIAKLQKENSVLISEVTETAKKLSALYEEISSEKLISQRLTKEYAEELQMSDKLKGELEKARLELNASKQEHSQLIDKYEEELRQHKTKINSLQNILIEKERDIEAARAEERDRAKYLHSAFNKYMSSLDSPKKIVIRSTLENTI